MWTGCLVWRRTRGCRVVCLRTLLLVALLLLLLLPGVIVHSCCSCPVR